ncbi:methyl-accepting chemotaxis protein [Pseudomonas sp. LPB0260]|uniref:methyl-accepting chemotaxis protein n=1 Tax=Pseudomonas sp. LPB0260 TaxID=2614442 RepID=UPI0015C215CD|nr:methyl-accepting chemotaxis protein [Pseudomonas sp. LPB0260]QLC72329.1 methyl-accepting chemotaxis protein [Pseudomonas sp. LPB0260]QLC75106.1 methyl-accepting chemotaxis protein [Pseudomonas sp. LPB0260]
MFRSIANLSIGSKLVLVFAALILGFAALLLTSLQRFASLQDNQAALFQRSFERVSKVKELRVNIITQRAELLQAMADAHGETGTRLAQSEGEIAELSKANDRLFDELLAGLGDESDTGRLLNQLIDVRNAFVQTRDQQLLPLIRAGQVQQAEALALGIQLQRMEQINDLGQRLAELTEQKVLQTLAQAQAHVERQRLEQLLLGLLMLLFGIVMAWQLSRHIAQPLAHLTLMAERISRGEIPRELRSETRRDEVGRLAQAFSQMSQYLLALAAKAEYLAQGHLGQDSQPVSDQDVLGTAFATMLANLRNLVGELNEGIAVLASSSEEVLAATSQVATNTQETATAISEIVTTVDEVKQTAVLASSKAQSVADSTARTREVAQGGRQAVEEALKGMGLIREQMQAVAESIMRLGEQSQTIGEIVASVSDLAEQSNLLGVNASIEAMRAGETGKGFSVVAQEVKALADQSKQATAQVRGILGEIQKAMTKAVLLAEQGSKTVESGYERAQSSGEAIRALDSSIVESNEMALQIAATSQQQMVGMDQVANAMTSIREASQSNVSGTRQMDQATRNLHELGLKLQGLAAQFKL